VTKDSKNPYLHTFDGIIWKLVYDPVNLLLCIEIRSENSLEVEYYTVFLTEKTEVKKIDLHTEVNWWTDLVGMQKDKIFFFTHNDQKNPGPGRFFIYDYQDNQVTLDRKDVSISLINENKIVLQSREVDDFQNEIIELNKKEHQNPSNIYFPDYFSVDDAYFEKIAGFLHKKLGINVVLGLEYLEQDNYLISSYYLKNGNKYDRYIVVFKHGESIFNKCIDRNMDGISTESFFLMENEMIFVENRDTLAVWELEY
jgi:hypothetical protein